MNPLHNEIALVTGASRGIGLVIAQKLAEQGAVVIGTATTEIGAQAITERLQAYAGQGMVLDVTDPVSISQVLGAVQQAFGAVSILVNNAGITRDNLLLRMNDEEWDAVLSTNLTALYRLSKACLRGMTKARKGRIINISSVVAATGNAGQSNYAAAKAGMIGFTKSLAREIGSRKITVNAIAPGFIATDMTATLTTEQRNTILNTIPLGELGTPDDIAAAVLFLASPGARYITGETLHVNGGMYMG